MIYELDGEKAKSNRRKHRITFEEAATVFLDPLALTFPDPHHSGQEAREITVGYSRQNRALFVSHCPRGDRIRIVSARKATQGERRQYEEGIGEEA